MSVCDRCNLDTGIECNVTVDGLNGTVVYSLCGFCASELKKFMKHI